jgi:hypothetical protein
MTPTPISPGLLFGLMTYRVFPVAEAIGILVRIPANHSDKGVQHQSEHEKYLEDGHVEFGNTKVFDG